MAEPQHEHTQQTESLADSKDAPRPPAISASASAAGIILRAALTAEAGPDSVTLAHAAATVQRTHGNAAMQRLARASATQPTLQRRRHRTGPGRTTTDPRVPAGGVHTVLTNWDIDSDELKPEHRDYLDRAVIPILAGHDARAWLKGSASHSGSDEHNLALSERRVNAVAAYLIAHGVTAAQINLSWTGEADATPQVNEADDDRSVSILTAPLVAPPPPVPPPRPPTTPARTPTATRFRIRMLGGLSAGTAGVQGDNHYFQIWDPAHALASIYVYFAAGGGRSVRLPLSVTLRGPWNDFSVTGAMAVNQFGGACRFTSGGGLWWTWNYINMMGLPPGIATIPRSMSIETGFTVGIGAGTTVGSLRIADTGPFSGP